METTDISKPFKQLNFWLWAKKKDGPWFALTEQSFRTLTEARQMRDRIKKAHRGLQFRIRKITISARDVQ